MEGKQLSFGSVGLFLMGRRRADSTKDATLPVPSQPSELRLRHTNGGVKAATPFGAQFTAKREIQHFGYDLSLHILRMGRTQNKHFSESRLSSLAQAFVRFKTLILPPAKPRLLLVSQYSFDSILTDVVLGHWSCTSPLVFYCLFGAETFSPSPLPIGTSSVSLLGL